MRSTLFEIENLSVLRALLIAVVFGGGGVLWLRRERRLGRMPEDEYRQSIYWVIGVGVLMAAAVWALSHWLGPIKIRAYGVMLMCAFVVGIVVAMKRAPRYQVEPMHVIDFALLVLVGSIVGSRVLYILLNWQAEYAGDPASMVTLWEGGLSFHGGLIGGTAGGFVFARWRKVRMSVLSDLMAPPLAFGYAVARIGCFLNGCCHGGPTDPVLGIDFPADDVAGPVHPVQLYSCVGSFLLGMVLLWLTPRVRVPGHLAMWYLLLYSALRSAMEHFRRGFTAEPWEAMSFLTQAQAFSILVAIVAAVVMLLTRTRTGYPLPEPEPPGGSKARQRRSKKRP